MNNLIYTIHQGSCTYDPTAQANIKPPVSRGTDININISCPSSFAESGVKSVEPKTDWIDVKDGRTCVITKKGLLVDIII